MTTLLVTLVDATVVLALALGVAAILRRRSAAIRHAIVASAMACALLTPLLELLLPQVPIIRWNSGEVLSSGATLTSTTAFVLEPTSEPRAPRISWPGIAAAIWLAGSLVMAAGLITALVRLSRVRKRCRPVAGTWREMTDELSRECGVTRKVALLQSADPSLLVTCGVMRPAIILPAGASAWPDTRRRVVLRHELAHIRRHDAALQILGELLRVVQWVNPLVWAACRRLRQESEYACDDAVLNAGVEPAEYATQLLGVARDLSGRHVAWPSATAIAHPSTLERRIIAMLHQQRNREPVGRRGWAFSAMVALGISVPLAAAGLAPHDEPVVMASAAPDVTLAAPRSEAPVMDPPVVRVTPPPLRTATRARQATGSIGGTIVDQTGGTLPGVQVTLSNAASGFNVTTQTDARGQFDARDLAAGDYELVARLPGFGTVSNRVKLAAGQNVQGSLTMPLGTVSETITVACAGPSAAVQSRWPGNAIFPMSAGQARPVSDGQAIRVGGNVRAPKKVTDVRPSCPSAPAAEANVRVTARIGREGSVSDILAQHSPGAAPPREFVDAVIDAVRQWKFTPTLLNGQAMEVGMTVTVTFSPAQ